MIVGNIFIFVDLYAQYRGFAKPSDAFRK